MLDSQKLKKILLLKYNKHIAIVILVAVAFILFIIWVIFGTVNVGNTPILIDIEGGQSLRSISGKLKESSLIMNESVFMIYVRLTGKGRDLKSGRYNFSGRISMYDIVAILNSGLSESNDIRLLVSEGFNVWEIDRRLVSLGLIEEGDFSSQYYNEEGYLFPDTYRINGMARGDDFIEELRQRMQDNFNRKTGELLGGLSLAESREIIIIASILEKEARTIEDMQLVSGIIQKRLSIDMLLQIDATVIYGACRRKFVENNSTKNCDVTLQGPAIEIPIDGPYNTYARRGLPLGPISSPGIKAINAALNPAESDYLFYLSTRDGSKMIYSKTASEHLQNRRKYLGF